MLKNHHTISSGKTTGRNGLNRTGSISQGNHRGAQFRLHMGPNRQSPSQCLERNPSQFISPFHSERVKILAVICDCGKDVCLLLWFWTLSHKCVCVGGQNKEFSLLENIQSILRWEYTMCRDNITEDCTCLQQATSPGTCPFSTLRPPVTAGWRRLWHQESKAPATWYLPLGDFAGTILSFRLLTLKGKDCPGSTHFSAPSCPPLNPLQEWIKLSHNCRQESPKVLGTQPLKPQLILPWVLPLLVNNFSKVVFRSLWCWAIR